LARLAGRRLGSDGVLTLVARTHRTQEANRRDAVQRLDALIAAARVAPKPRKPTRPTRAAKERRLREKLRKGQVKSTRRRPVAED
jgi:ribosome-associated protein